VITLRHCINCQRVTLWEVETGHSLCHNCNNRNGYKYQGIVLDKYKTVLKHTLKPRKAQRFKKLLRWYNSLYDKPIEEYVLLLESWHTLNCIWHPHHENEEVKLYLYDTYKKIHEPFDKDTHRFQNVLFKPIKQ